MFSSQQRRTTSLPDSERWKASICRRRQRRNENRKIAWRCPLPKNSMLCVTNLLVRLRVVLMCSLKLKIARPALKPPHQTRGEKDNWNNVEDNEEEVGARSEWRESSGPGFFVLRSLPSEACRPADISTAQLDPSLEGKWAGMPNYKKFRPVSFLMPSSDHSDCVSLERSSCCR